MPENQLIVRLTSPGLLPFLSLGAPWNHHKHCDLFALESLFPESLSSLPTAFLPQGLRQMLSLVDTLLTFFFFATSGSHSASVTSYSPPVAFVPIFPWDVPYLWGGRSHSTWPPCLLDWMAPSALQLSQDTSRGLDASMSTGTCVDEQGVFATSSVPVIGRCSLSLLEVKNSSFSNQGKLSHWNHRKSSQ